MSADARDLDAFQFGPDGLAPVVIQDAATSAVLMLAYMNAEALRLTRETGRTHFWSRSRGKLWRKGETSGHEQFVRDIYVNCEVNTLLIEVDQVGAVCHDGYPTCFYRRVEGDGEFEIVRERWFDPRDVYPGGETLPPGPAVLTRLWYGAFEFLRDHDLVSVSSTSRRLRDGEFSGNGRIADELHELAGVLDGSHQHRTLADDAVLEGSQVCYWIAVASVAAGLGFDELMPDRALSVELDPTAALVVAKLLRVDASGWLAAGRLDFDARARATLTLVAQACRAVGVEPMALIDADLADLRAKPYLTSYFNR